MVVVVVVVVVVVTSILFLSFMSTSFSDISSSSPRPDVTESAVVELVSSCSLMRSLQQKWFLLLLQLMILHRPDRFLWAENRDFSAVFFRLQTEPSI